jgi:hypothetical protein
MSTQDVSPDTGVTDRENKYIAQALGLTMITLGTVMNLLMGSISAHVGEWRWYATVALGVAAGSFAVMYWVRYTEQRRVRKAGADNP